MAMVKILSEEKRKKIKNLSSILMFNWYKTLNAAFKSNEMIKLFLNSTYSEVYFRVLKEGKIYKNDHLILLNRENNSIKVSEIYSLFTTNKKNKELIKNSLALKTLSPKIKNDIQRKLL